MNFGYWNIHRNRGASLLPVLVDFIIEKTLDVFVLIESEVDPTELLSMVQDRGIKLYHLKSRLLKTKFQVFVKIQPDLCRILKEKPRLLGWEMPINKDINISLILIHFQDQGTFSDSNQNAQSPEIKGFIDSAEKEVQHMHTIVLGDFNMNPFQHGMVQTTGLHATMDKKTAIEGSRIVSSESYRYFYNPMWSFFGERGHGKVNGTFYYRKSEPITYFWNILDQVILRPELLGYFDENSLEILTIINKTNLIDSNGRIDKLYSDHLPLFFTMNF